MTLYNFFKSVLKMPYYKNYAAASGAVHNINKHEKAVEDQLNANGFVSANLPARKGSSSPISASDRDKAMIESGFLLGIPNNSYVSQPCGANNSPDFIVNSNNKLYFIECKSAEGCKPVYNSGLPKKGYIYIFCSEKANETTVYMGEDIVSDAQRALIQQYKEKQASLTRQLNEGLRELDSLQRGIDFYLRPMYNQSGGKERANYFTHQNRNSSEEKVLNYVS